mmetsp:Transcript_11783/g.29859  ORF Transcript_11783/g.29859 Transcript_11783/m.29859 type:complete len:231 (-) Transcript_11783:281-973(-)
MVVRSPALRGGRVLLPPPMRRYRVAPPYNSFPYTIAPGGVWMLSRRLFPEGRSIIRQPIRLKKSVRAWASIMPARSRSPSVSKSLTAERNSVESSTTMGEGLAFIHLSHRSVSSRLLLASKDDSSEISLLPKTNRSTHCFNVNDDDSSIHEVQPVDPPSIPVARFMSLAMRVVRTFPAKMFHALIESMSYFSVSDLHSASTSSVSERLSSIGVATGVSRIQVVVRLRPRP